MACDFTLPLGPYDQCDVWVPAVEW